MLSNSLPDADLNLPEMKPNLPHVHQEGFTCVMDEKSLSPLSPTDGGVEGGQWLQMTGE